MAKVLYVVAALLVLIGLLAALMVPTETMGARDAFFAKFVVVAPPVLVAILLFALAVLASGLRRLERQGAAILGRLNERPAAPVMPIPEAPSPTVVAPTPSDAPRDGAGSISLETLTVGGAALATAGAALARGVPEVPRAEPPPLSLAPDVPMVEPPAAADAAATPAVPALPEIEAAPPSDPAAFEPTLDLAAIDDRPTLADRIMGRAPDPRPWPEPVDSAPDLAPMAATSDTTLPSLDLSDLDIPIAAESPADAMAEADTAPDAAVEAAASVVESDDDVVAALEAALERATLDIGDGTPTVETEPRLPPALSLDDLIADATPVAAPVPVLPLDTVAEPTSAPTPREPVLDLSDLIGDDTPEAPTPAVEEPPPAEPAPVEATEPVVDVAPVAPPVAAEIAPVPVVEVPPVPTIAAEPVPPVAPITYETPPAPRPPTVEEFLARDVEPAADEPPPSKVVREGQFAGRRYRMFENGSLEIDTDQSTIRFGSLDEFRAFVAAASRRPPEGDRPSA